MFNNLKRKWYDRCTRWSKIGMMMPYWYDPVTKQPSITIMFAYITFVLATTSVVAYHFKAELVLPTITAIGFWVLAVVFYLLRKITSAKVDLKNRSFEIGNNSDSDADQSNNDAEPTDGTQPMIDSPD